MPLALTVEVGGSSIQSAYFEGMQLVRVVDGVAPLAPATRWAVAAPGLVVGRHVSGAHHLGWMDADVASELGYDSSPSVSMNDAAAAALGEWVLRGADLSITLLYVGVGTGVGSGVVRSGTSADTALGHLQGFGSRTCGGCGGIGCLDAVAGGHALPWPLTSQDVVRVAEAVSAAINRQHQDIRDVVLGGGVLRSAPHLVDEVALRLPEHRVMATSAPAAMKSAAAFGLAWELDRLRDSGPPRQRST